MCVGSNPTPGIKQVRINNLSFLHSLWYGQDFFDDHKYAIDGPIVARNLTDFSSKLQHRYTEDEVTRKFEKIFLPQSDLLVHSIVNIIYIYRSMVRL